MLGRLGTEALAAVGYATQFFMLAQSLLLAVGAVCVALVARAVGGRDPLEARRAFAASLLLAQCVALTLTAPVLLAPEFLLGLLNAPPGIVARAVPYFQLTLGSSLLLAFSFTYESAFRAVGDTRTPLRIVGLVTLVKISLNAVLIFGLLGIPRLELVGAGIATILAQLVAVGFFARAGTKTPYAAMLRLGAAELRGAWGRIADALRMALPALTERLVLHAAILVYFSVLGDYGPIAVAAYTIGVRVLSFSWIPGTGFAVAAATLVGQSLGAGEPRSAVRAGWRAVRFAVSVSVVLGSLYALARVPIAALFTGDPVVIAALDPFMLVLALAQPLLGLHFTLGGSLRGAGDTLSPMWAAALGNWVLRVPLALLFARVLELGVVWVWSTLVFDHLARAIWLVVVFRRGRWQQRSWLRARASG